MPTKLIRVDAFGQSPVAILGYIPIDTHRRFSDEINTNQESITLQDAMYLNLNTAPEPPRKLAEAKNAALHKRNLVMIRREAETEEEKEFRPMLTRTLDKAQVDLLAGNWLISGVVSMAPRQPVSQAIAAVTSPLLFLPVTSAKAMFTPNPKIELPLCDVLLVNRYWITAVLSS
jgi:hypothetical protein